LNAETQTASLATEQKVGAKSADADAVAAKDAVAKPAEIKVADPKPALKQVKGAPPAPRTTEALTASATPGSAGYKIGPLDVVEVSVFKVPELSKTVQVTEAGTINLPLIGEVSTAGRTAQDVERELAVKLGAKYLQSPQVTVFVKEFNSQRVTVEGSVKKPGVYPLRGKTTLMQTIAMSEGLDNATSSNSIVIFRQVDKKKTAARFEIDEIRSGAVQDPDIKPGDLIVVDASKSKELLNTVSKLLPLTSVFVGLL
jgi:polysaccharide biosynthesis/export protein